MPEKELLFDLDSIDLNHPIAGLEEIRSYNPQRFEMEQLSGVLHGLPGGFSGFAPDALSGAFWESINYQLDLN